MNRVVVCCALLAAVILAFAKDSIPDVVLTAKTVAVLARVGVAANAKTAPNRARARKHLQQALTKWAATKWSPISRKQTWFWSSLKGTPARSSKRAQRTGP